MCPGAIDTAMLAPLMADANVAAQVAGSIPVGRVGRPDEIAAAILFLCSPAASYAVGQLMLLDGGVSLA